uniref:MBD domain-containing protein n=1 Tax=Trichobilharzia regenti TaxID=157069 RepID=A0AA85K8D9_TRIRE|nr:unnamed protein product [Trichobilharzia regenti]
MANQETISTKAKEESPPDRIVASYAAAAHAAALACHQPISRAAEAYLATTCCNSRSRHSSKRSRTVNHLTTTSTLLTTSTTTTTTSTGNNRSNFNYATSLASLALLPSTTTSFIPSETNSVESHKGWTRKVDRKANTVVYISSDGIHMHNVDDVYAYLSAKYPSECLNNPNVKEMIATQFIFTPTNNNNNNNNATIHSLTDTIKFVHSLQVSALKNNAKQDDDDDNSTVSRLNTTHSPSKSSTTISNSVHNSSPEKTSSICRINFNPDHHSANNGSSPAKRSKLSDTSCVIINGESNELSSVSFSSSSDAYTVCSTQSSISSNPIECSVKQDLSNVSNTVVDTLTRDRGGACIQSSDLDSDQCCSNSETVSTLSANTTYTNDNISNRTSQNNIVQNGNNNNNIIAKLTTETLTTGALRNSMPSFTTEIVPSVFSSPLNKPMEHQIGTDLTNLLTDPCQLNFSTGSSNALQQQQQQQLASMMNHPLLLEQILAINRLAHIQQQHQQQQVNTTQLTTATQNTIEGGNSLGSQQSLSPTNPILSSLTNSWISSASNLQPTTTRITSLQELAMNNNPAVNSLSAVLQQHQQVQQQHQQLLALAALQQQHQQHQHQQQQQHQQAQFLAVLQAAALLQQQQQHQQQSGNSPIIVWHLFWHYASNNNSSNSWRLLLSKLKRISPPPYNNSNNKTNSTSNNTNSSLIHITRKYVNLVVPLTTGLV